MTEHDGALGRLLAQVDAGTDCLVEGAPAALRALFARAAALLAERADVITVVSPLSELGLSSLIAQISGRPDFDEQDDAVLELGFKRLTAPGKRIVLMLGAPQGIGLPALRYLQHVGRAAPGLLLVVLGSPAFHAALEQPGAAALRTRLRAGPVILADDAPAAASVEATPLVAPPGPIPLSSPEPRPRRSLARLLPWAAVAVSVAAASVIVVQLSRVSGAEAPTQGPMRGAGQAPSAALAPPAVLAPALTSAPVTQTSTAIAPAAPAVETPIDVQPPVAAPPVTFPAPAVAPPLPPLVKPDRVLHARRTDPKQRAIARAPRPSPEWRVDEPTQYSWDSERPAWRRRDWRWEEEQRQGAYAVDRYGTPLYPLSR